MVNLLSVGQTWPNLVKLGQTCLNSYYLVRVVTFHVRPLLADQILVGQSQNPQMIKLKEEIEKGKKAEFQIRDDDMIVKGQRMCVLEYGELKRDIMEEAHSSAYAMHPGSTKMYKTLKEHYWWNGMKKEIASFVSRCLTCQQVKAEHQKPVGKIQLLPIPVWKWENITMDFVTGLPRTQRQHDAIWMIVDRLTKSAHFLQLMLRIHWKSWPNCMWMR